MGDFAKTPSNEFINREEKKEEVKIPSDEFITKEEEDLLNRGPFVKLVVDLIEGGIEAPYSIGIYGDWGSGKTSIMKLIEEKVKESGRYRVIWFDAWEYENETNLIYPLIHLIQKEIPLDKSGQVRQSVGKLTSVILKAGCDMFLGRLTAGAVNVKRLEKYEDDYIKKHTKMFDTWIDRVGEAKKEFKTLTEAACESKEKEEGGKECIVIFIDDLDRCLPEKSIKILESIKNIFSQGKCIFILGVDKRTIAHVIEGRYRTLTAGECRDYLAKIVPFGIYVPECQEIDFDNYLKSLIFNKLKIKLGSKTEVKHETDIVRIDLGEISKICVASRLHNPRKIKKSVIAFYLYYRISKSDGFDPDFINEIRSEGVTYQDVLMFCLFYEFWEDLFEKILIDNSLFTALSNLAHQSDFEGWQKQFLTGNIEPVIKSMEPDRNLHNFLRGWKWRQRKEFINVLIRIGRLIGLKKE